MNKLMLAFLASASMMSFGCGKKGGGAGDAVAKYEEFKNAMCKCGEGDTACAQKVLDDQKKWGEEMAKKAGDAKDAKPDPDMQKKMEPIITEMTKCSTKAMTPKMGGAGGGGGGGGGGGAKTTLTQEKIDEAAKNADPDKVDEAIKMATDKLGAPAKTEGDMSIWYGTTKDGAGCYQLRISKTKGIDQGTSDKANCGL